MNLSPVNEAFARCRHLYSPDPHITGLLLAAEQALTTAGEDLVLSKTSAELLRLCSAAVLDLQRLWEANELSSMRQVGYAMHVVPGILGADEDFEPALFVFNVRVAASSWGKLSHPFQKALASAAGLDFEEVDRLCQDEGFRVEIELP